MNDETVIDVEARFIDSDQDDSDIYMDAPVSSTLVVIFNLAATIGNIVLFFWLLGIFFSLLVPFTGAILSFLLTIFLGIPICAYALEFAARVETAVCEFAFGVILIPFEKWIIKLFTK